MVVYLLIGLLVSIGWHFGKLLFDLVSEIMFTRLHKNETYAAICKKTPEGPRPNIQDGQIRKNMPIGFTANRES